MRITLENKRDMVLHFADALAEKFTAISDEFNVPLEMLWALYNLQKRNHNGDQYAIRSVPLQDFLEHRFDEVEDAVIQALDSTERTSSMVENLNGRVRRYIGDRQVVGHGFLDLLRFFLNHSLIVRSARPERRGKSP